MNRLFNVLRRIVEHPKPTEVEPEQALPLVNFDQRVEVLFGHAEQAAAYEDDLTDYLHQSKTRLEQIQDKINRMLDAGRDRDAFELVRLAARIRPQYDLVNQEIQAFHTVASDLIRRVDTLMEHLEEARELARNGRLNPAATRTLEDTLNRLTRYFVLLERVSQSRRRALPDLLAERMTAIIDDHQLDLQLARYVLARRRALGPGNTD